MDEQEIVKVVRKLVGDTTPIGETYHDNKVLANVMTYMGVIDRLVMRIIDNITLMPDYMKSYASVQDCREQMFTDLKLIKKRIEECFEEEEVK